MKFFIVFLALFAIACAEFTEEEEKKWRDFKLQHGKMFLSPGKEKDRKKTFLKNAKDVDEHNEKFLNGEATYTKTIHKHSDLSDEDFISRFGGATYEPDTRSSPPITLRQTNVANLDLSTRAGVGPVRDQSSCGSCWAFCSIAAVEYAYWKKTGSAVDLSEQQLVDCVYDRSGCNGGWMSSAMNYIAQNGGVGFENQYPYQATWGTCRASSLSGTVWLKSTSYLRFASDDESIKSALNNYGVLAIAVDANYWGSYKSGIFQAPNYSSPSMNHGVALVGYGTDSNGIPYWKIRNSWNTWWGEEGYMRLDARRDANGNTLGGIFLDTAYFPQID